MVKRLQRLCACCKQPTKVTPIHGTLHAAFTEDKKGGCRRWRKNPSRNCLQERSTRGTVSNASRRPVRHWRWLVGNKIPISLGRTGSGPQQVLDAARRGNRPQSPFLVTIVPLRLEPQAQRQRWSNRAADKVHVEVRIGLVEDRAEPSPAQEAPPISGVSSRSR